MERSTKALPIFFAGLLLAGFLSDLMLRAAGVDFNFEAPAGPEFSEQEKGRQRERGMQFVPTVLKAFESGSDFVRIPPGDYRFGKETWDRDGVVYPLQFRGLNRDADHPFRIIAEGVTLWFDLPPDQAPSAHFALGFVECSNLTLVGASLDRDPRGCMEGRITQLDEAGNRIEIEASKGTLILKNLQGGHEERLVPFNADGTFCAALYALQHVAPARLGYRSVESGTLPGRYWVNLSERSELLKTNNSPEWNCAYGEAGTLQVGDGLCLISTTTTAIGVHNCKGLRFIGVSNYITKGGVHESGGGGGHLWKDCYFGPRPGTCQWQGSDGFLSGGMKRGSTLEGCTMLHTTDDVLNFNGSWGYIESVAGNTVTLGRVSRMPAHPGDRLSFIDKQSGIPLGSARVQSAIGQMLTLDCDAAVFANAVAENPRWQNSGWEVRNCDFRDCYQRFLIQGSGGGMLRNCRFTRIGSGILLDSNFFTNKEGGICHGIQVLDNIFEDVASHPEGVALQVGFQSFNNRAGTPLVGNIIVRGNRFVNSGRRAIEFNLVSGGDISGNTLIDSGRPRVLAGKASPEEVLEPVRLKECIGVTVRDNRP